MNNTIWLSILVPLLLATACASGAPSPTPTSSRPWTEEEVTFASGADELYGVMTLPTSPGPYPAIVIVSGSASPTTGVRAGASSQYHIDHARHMVRQGFAVLRYDPPGVGRSGGEPGFESLDSRTEEAIAALHYVQGRPDIWPQQVGLWADSQGGWVIAKAAAAYPLDVAFIMAVSGSGVSVAEQQVYSIEASSKAARMSDEDIRTAVLFGRLLIDWQLATPLYRETSEAEAQALGDGPWTRFMALVYQPGQISTAESLQQAIAIFKEVQDEPWARFLYLKELYIPQLETIPPEQVAAVKAAAEQSLLENPQEYLTKVRCPVLAVFGEEDALQPTVKSAALYEQYLTEAGNESFKIVVLPGVGHSIGLSTPGYWEALSAWLDHLYS